VTPAPLPAQEPKPKNKNRSVLVSVLIFSVGVHVLASLVAAAYVVVKWIAPPEATFVAKKMVALPPQIIDPRMASAELEAAAPKPVLDEKIASIRETDVSLPDIPQIQTDQVAEFDPSALITDAAVGLGAGAGGGGGGGSGGGGEGSGLNFFGIQTQAKSVIIVFDISKSVLTKAQKAGVPITSIREETLKLIDALSINTKFNLVQFSRIYQPMAPEMQPPNDSGKAAAKDWLERQFRTDGILPRSVRGAVAPGAGEDNGIAFVLRGVLAMQPDTVFLISDASFQSELHSSQVPWKEVEEVVKAHEKSGGQTKIHVIGFEMKPDDKKEIRSIARRTGGTVREIGKD
jgi:hypothetical protein